MSQDFLLNLISMLRNSLSFQRKIYMLKFNFISYQTFYFLFYFLISIVLIAVAYLAVSYRIIRISPFNGILGDTRHFHSLPKGKNKTLQTVPLIIQRLSWKKSYFSKDVTRIIILLKSLGKKLKPFITILCLRMDFFSRLIQTFQFQSQLQSHFMH